MSIGIFIGDKQEKVLQTKGYPIAKQIEEMPNYTEFKGSLASELFRGTIICHSASLFSST